MGFFATDDLSGWQGIATGFALATVLAVIVVVAFLKRARRAVQDQAAAAATARRNQVMVDASGEGVLELDAEGRIRYANPAALRLSGFGSDELLGRDYRSLFSVSEPKIADLTKRFATDMRSGVGAMLRRKDGRMRPVEYRSLPLASESARAGSAAGAMLFAFADKSERARTDAMLFEMQSTAKIGAWEFWPENDQRNGQLIWTDEVYRIHDLPPGSALDVQRILQHYDGASRGGSGKLWREALLTGETFQTELRLTTVKGRVVWLHLVGNVERQNGRTVRMFGIVQDITEHRDATRQLNETRDFFAQTLDALPMVIAYVNADGIVTYCNRHTSRWWARPREQVIGRALVDLVGRDSYADLAPYIAQVLAGVPQSFAYDSEIRSVYRDWQVYCVPETGTDGRVLGFIALLHDLTETKQLQARLAHAQKMEAIGQLTGGIAHDFNNMLGIIIGNLQLLERGMQEQPNQLRKLQTAMRAALRGSDLTRRLLAFARRQSLEPEIIDLNRCLKDWDELLHRTLGDSIEVRVHTDAELWATQVDPGQIESALLNLAINARDAMTHGGVLTVETSNRHVDQTYLEAHPELQPDIPIGDYTCIAVSDTGVGIPPDTLKSVFEPFFTTKEPGKGSGLGLSMVHGFAKQSGGAASIVSIVGVGTSVCLYLPRATATSRAEEAPKPEVVPRGAETILVVEDDADLRETSVANLAQLGYRVLQAGTGEQALQVLARHDDVDLMFTDIMMPGGLLGPGLAQRAREIRPQLAVLYTTGYANSGALDGGVAYSEILAKPFRAEELAVRIRQLLDREVRVA